MYTIINVYANANFNKISDFLDENTRTELTRLLFNVLTK